MPRTDVHEFVFQIDQVRFKNEGNYVLDISIEPKGNQAKAKSHLKDIRIQVDETKEPNLGRSFTTKPIRQKFPDRVSVLNAHEKKIKFFIPSGESVYFILKLNEIIYVVIMIDFIFLTYLFSPYKSRQNLRRIPWPRK